MDITFESLYELVTHDAENGKAMLDKTELGHELIELVREAKLLGVSAYKMVEDAILGAQAENKANATPPEILEDALETPAPAITAPVADASAALPADCTDGSSIDNPREDGSYGCDELGNAGISLTGVDRTNG